MYSGTQLLRIQVDHNLLVCSELPIKDERLSQLRWLLPQSVLLLNQQEHHYHS